MRSFASPLYKALRTIALPIAALAVFSTSPACAYFGEFDGGGQVGNYLDIVSSAMLAAAERKSPEFVRQPAL